MKTPTIEDLVAAYAAGKSIRYQTGTGFSELYCKKQGYPHGNPRYGFRHSSHTTEQKSLAFLTPSPEESIRRALAEPRPGLGFRTLEIWDKVAETSAAPPAPATVPLGENVTRSGLHARVLSNDSTGDYPVVAEVQMGFGSRNTILRRYKADGKSRADSKLDLVGHRHHEIKAPEDTELEDLRRWKAEAIQCMPDYPAIGEEMGLTIGDDVPSSILPYIRRLKAKLEAAKKALQ